MQCRTANNSTYIKLVHKIIT